MFRLNTQSNTAVQPIWKTLFRISRRMTVTFVAPVQKGVRLEKHLAITIASGKCHLQFPTSGFRWFLNAQPHSTAIYLGMSDSIGSGFLEQIPVHDRCHRILLGASLHKKHQTNIYKSNKPTLANILWVKQKCQTYPIGRWKEYCSQKQWKPMKTIENPASPPMLREWAVHPMSRCVATSWKRSRWVRRRKLVKRTMFSNTLVLH